MPTAFTGHNNLTIHQNTPIAITNCPKHKHTTKKIRHKAKKTMHKTSGGTGSTSSRHRKARRG